MSTLPRTTIEQWAVLRTVVDHGGFAQAAAHLNRSQSSVSYAVARLQDGLSVQLLEIQGRKAILTQAGRSLLAEASALVDDLLRLEERGRALAGGESPLLRLIVDSLFPKGRLFRALDVLAARHPHVEVRLLETVKRANPDPAQTPYDIAITMPGPGARYGRRIIEIELVAVARHDHPLAAKSLPLSTAALTRHLRVDIRSDGRPYDTITADGKTWEVSTVEAAHAAVQQGLCYGWLPRDLVAREMEEGTLCALPLATGGGRVVPLDLSFGDADRITPAARFLADLLMVG